MQYLLKLRIKKIAIIIGKTVLMLTACILLYLLFATVLSGITVDREETLNESVSIYIKTNGVHTDIVLPVKNKQKDWSSNIRFENTLLKDSTYQFVALGWGDKGFYLETPEWSDLKVSVAFKAATGLGNTAMHATFYHRMMESETCKEIRISEAQYERLIVFIENSFQKNAQAQFLPISTNANYGKTDAFYEAIGSYSIFHTCNTWANNALKSCGQKCCPWTPFDSGIFEKYKK